MLKQFNQTTLHRAIARKIEEKTGLRCFDEIPDNTRAPFYSLAIVGKDADNTKSCYRAIYEAEIHIFTPPRVGSVESYRHLEALEEALSEEIALPEPFYLYKQEAELVRAIEPVENGDRHAVAVWRFGVVHGFMTKD